MATTLCAWVADGHGFGFRTTHHGPLELEPDDVVVRFDDAPDVRRVVEDAPDPLPYFKLRVENGLPVVLVLGGTSARFASAGRLGR